MAPYGPIMSYDHLHWDTPPLPYLQLVEIVEHDLVDEQVLVVRLHTVVATRADSLKNLVCILDLQFLVSFSSLFSFFEEVCEL